MQFWTAIEAKVRLSPFRDVHNDAAYLLSSCPSVPASVVDPTTKLWCGYHSWRGS